MTRIPARFLLLAVSLLSGISFTGAVQPARAGDDPIREMTAQGVENDFSPVMNWGTDPEKYSNWTSHSNRLIPVYTFGTKGAGAGIDLGSYQGKRSPYRSEEAIRKLYGRLPADTLNPSAAYFDQANLAEIQKAALDAGKKHIFLVVFDGMDWQTTFAAAIYQRGCISYREGRGTGLHLQDYDAAGTSQFGMVVTSPHNDDTKVNVNSQEVTQPGGLDAGGYDPSRGGKFAWSEVDPESIGYLIGKTTNGKPAHAVPDSSSTAATMCAGVKTFNGAIGVGPTGERLTTIAHLAQERGMAVGVISSVPISHATPGSAYAHNVTRADYQDITRDLLGLPSISHPENPLPGMDVVIGAGWGVNKSKDSGQGKNFVSGNRYLAADDLKKINVANGGRYTLALRTAGKSGRQVLDAATGEAIENGTRLFGYFGTAKYAHLPFRTGDGNHDPVKGTNYDHEIYNDADIQENPTLAEMTSAGLSVLAKNPKGFWVMVEAGDVDWANHDNNLDSAIGAVFSGDHAVKAITDWVEKNSNWRESLLIVTADHGHYLHIKKPEKIAEAGNTKQK